MNAQPSGGKIRTVIVDDELLARSNLSVLLRADADIEIVGEFGSGEEAQTEIRRTRPDLLFLDVQMPECDGFDVLELLGSEVPPAVIFVTAYDQYALRAFDTAALDYLLKPFDDARFARALDRAKQRIAQQKDQPRKPRFVTIRSAGQVTFLPIDEIDWIEAADYYAGLHVAGKTHLLRRTIAELEQDLDAEVFCRIHRSAIVNLHRVRGLKLNQDGEYMVVLEGGTCLRLSRRYRKLVQARLGI
ncbi:MAG TPA: LytTR family DNA-binding domain-containing protein [Acidobacteriaceae bacterium]|nr:LytTR family DNA-binding domain-containing protein [Acidobacteriaceae bacterium]